MVNYNTIVLAGFAFVIIGMLMIVLGSILQSSSSSGSSKTEVHTGGVILIGPIPVIFGNDKQLVIFGVIFAIVIMILYYLLFYRGAV